MNSLRTEQRISDRESVRAIAEFRVLSGRLKERGF